LPIPEVGLLISKEQQATAYDPILYDYALPLAGTFYPRGFSLEISTNSPDVLLAAEESWGTCGQAFNEAAVRMSIGVVQGGSDAALSPPVCRGRNNLISLVSDAQNFYSADLREGFGFGWVTQATVSNRAGFRYHFLEGMALCLLMSRYMTPIHAACVVLDRQGVLLCGDSGEGKSSLSFACARRGWTFVADDSSSLIRNRAERTVVGNPHQIRFRQSAIDLFPELAYERLTRRVNGELAIELPTSSLAHFSIALQAPVNHIVFLRRKNFAAVRLTRLSVERVLPWFEQVLTYGEPDVRKAQKASLRRLLTANLVEMTYSDLDSAVSCLESLVRSNS
jgi:hypothetical protein